MSNHQFQVNQLRFQNLIAVFQAFFVYVFSLTMTQYLSDIILKFFYDVATLTEAPMIIEELPRFLQGIAVVFFVYVAASSVSRELKARKLEAEMVFSEMDGCCGSGSCGCDSYSDMEMEKLEKIVDGALEQAAAPTSKKSKKSKK